jgi:two-component system, NarL family, sensor kinase
MRIPRPSPVAQFAIAGTLAMLAVGLLAVAVLEQVGRREAIRDAKRVSSLAGDGIVAPNLTPGVLAGDRDAMRRFDAVVRDRVRRQGIVRVKLWGADGRVIYSDERRLIGRRFPLGADEAAALRAHRVEAEVSDLTRPENRYERPAGKLLEVYLPITGPDGRPLLFEAYERFSSVTTSGRRLWLAFAPALLGGLLLLQLLNLPLARSLARRLRRAHEQALDAAQRERRAIAADLHDGVVQDLVGVTFSLAAQAERVNGSNPEATEALRQGAAHTRDSVRALRTLLVDIYPPSLHRAGIAAALGDLATTYSGRGMTTTVHVQEGARMSDPAEQLLFRSTQELLRNAHQHGRAAHARVRLERAGDRTILHVSDDGQGFDPARPREGHFGLRVLHDLILDAAGSIAVDSAPGRGTRVRVEVPR